MKCCFALALCAALPVLGENLVFNSSFELGEKGWNGFCENKLTEEFTKKYPGKLWQVDSSTAHSGKNSLKVSLKGTTVRTAVFSHDIPVKFGKIYTVSFYAKSDEKVRCPAQMRACMVPPNRAPDGSIIPPTSWAKDVPQVKTHIAVPSGNVDLMTGPEWKRYSFTFTPRKDMAAYTFSIDSRLKNHTIWIDDIQVEENARLTPYRPANPVEIALYLPDRTVGAQKVEGKAVAVSYGSDKRNYKTKLSLYNLYSDRIEDVRELRFDLKTGKVQKKTFAFGSLKYGMYTVFHSLQPRITTRAYETSPEKPAAQRSTKLKDGDRSYQSAACIASVPKPPRIQNGGYLMGPCVNFNGSVTNRLYRDGQGLNDEFAQVLHDSGATVCKIWNATNWNILEPERGKYAWEYSDSIINSLNKYGLRGIFIVIGASFGDRNNPWSPVSATLPQWVLDRDIAGAQGARNRNVVNARYKTLWRSSQTDWGDYISAIAKRYKGKIHAYEIFNEPQLFLSSEDYIQYLKTAYPAIKRIDPGALVVGICATSDFGVNADSFIARIIRMGGGNSLDMISYHPYVKLDDSNPSQMAQYAGIFKNLRQSGVNKPLVNTENYFFENGDAFYYWWNKAPDYDISRYIRHHIIDMGEGLAMSTTVEYDSAFFSSFIHPAQVYHNGSRHGRVQPNLRYAVQAGTSRLISGAKPVGKIDLSSGALGYTYRKDGRLFTALWNARAKQKSWITLELPAKVSFAEYDIFSNPLKSQNGKITLELGPEPRYFEWKNASPETVAAIFKSPQERCENPIRIRNANLLRRNGKWELRVSVENLSGNVLRNPVFTVTGKALKTPVRLIAESIGYFRTAELTGTVAVIENCASDEKMEISSPMLKPIGITVPLRRSAEVSYTPRTFAIENVILGKPESKEDLSATMELAMKNISTLRVTVTVKDDKPSQNLQHAAFLRDSVELFVDRDPFGGLPGGGYNRFCNQYIAARGGRLDRVGFKTLFTERKNGYVWIFEIPVVFRHNVIALDLAVNDSDGDKLKSKISWSGHGDSYRNRRNFIILELNRGDGAVISAAVRDGQGKILQLKNNESVPFLPTSEWVKHEFRFVPEFSGRGNIVCRSSLGTKPTKNLLFRNLSVQGAKADLPASGKELKAPWIPAEFQKGVPVTISCELKKNEIQK